MPGTTAAARLSRWIDKEQAAMDAHADARGRDAFAFEPIVSDYLSAGEDLVVRTPYSKTVVRTLRSLPLARWDPAVRAWRLPYRGFDALRTVWPTLEAAARRRAPGAARPEPNPAERFLRAERRRRRLPVPEADPPPLGAVLATPFGLVVVEAIDRAPIAPSILQAHPAVPDAVPRVWARWRPAEAREAAGSPTAGSVDPGDRSRGWWLPTPEAVAEHNRDLRLRARAARARRHGPEPA